MTIPAGDILIDIVWLNQYGKVVLWPSFIINGYSAAAADIPCNMPEMELNQPGAGKCYAMTRRMQTISYWYGPQYHTFTRTISDILHKYWHSLWAVYIVRPYMGWYLRHFTLHILQQNQKKLDISLWFIHHILCLLTHNHSQSLTHELLAFSLIVRVSPVIYLSYVICAYSQSLTITHHNHSQSLIHEIISSPIHEIISYLIDS